METQDKTQTEINNANDLNKMLTDTLIAISEERIPTSMAKSIALIADKINKNNLNTIEYKKLTMHIKPIDFFEI